eukprot:3082310-Alexandrium_andersonii.AAC.1
MMLRIRNCTDVCSWRSDGDHVGSQQELFRAWQNNLDPNFMETRSFFYHDCLDVMDVAAYDYSQLPEFDL